MTLLESLKEEVSEFERGMSTKERLSSEKEKIYIELYDELGIWHHYDRPRPQKKIKII